MSARRSRGVSTPLRAVATCSADRQITLAAPDAVLIAGTLTTARAHRGRPHGGDALLALWPARVGAGYRIAGTTFRGNPSPTARCRHAGYPRSRGAHSRTGGVVRFSARSTGEPVTCRGAAVPVPALRGKAAELSNHTPAENAAATKQHHLGCFPAGPRRVNAEFSETRVNLVMGAPDVDPAYLLGGRAGPPSRISRPRPARSVPVGRTTSRSATFTAASSCPRRVRCTTAGSRGCGLRERHNTTWSAWGGPRPGAARSRYNSPIEHITAGGRLPHLRRARGETRRAGRPCGLMTTAGVGAVSRPGPGLRDEVLALLPNALEVPRPEFAARSPGPGHGGPGV